MSLCEECGNTADERNKGRWRCKSCIEGRPKVDVRSLPRDPIARQISESIRASIEEFNRMQDKANHRVFTISENEFKKEGYVFKTKCHSVDVLYIENGQVYIRETDYER